MSTGGVLPLRFCKTDADDLWLESSEKCLSLTSSLNAFWSRVGFLKWFLFVFCVCVCLGGCGRSTPVPLTASAGTNLHEGGSQLASRRPDR